MFRYLLALHIAGGVTALASGLVPIFTRKGGTAHRRGGLVFAGAMALTSAVAFVLAIVIWNVLLLVIAVFTSFLVYIGVRAIRLRRGDRVIPADEAACGLAAAFSAWLLWSGLFEGDVTSLVFGVAGMGLALRQDHALSNPATNWMAVHLGTMGGAYIATVSAVMVVNFTTAPKPLVFLGPAMIGTPLLIWAGRRYRRRPPVARARDSAPILLV